MSGPMTPYPNGADSRPDHPRASDPNPCAPVPGPVARCPGVIRRRGSGNGFNHWGRRRSRCLDHRARGRLLSAKNGGLGRIYLGRGRDRCCNACRRRRGLACIPRFGLSLRCRHVNHALFNASGRKKGCCADSAQNTNCLYLHISNCIPMSAEFDVTKPL
jgi:hypothetical protein